MSYQCRDCSFTQQGQFPHGRCPACGSFNVQRQASDNTAPDRPQGKTWRLLLSMLLWLILGYLLYKKL